MAASRRRSSQNGGLSFAVEGGPDAPHIARRESQAALEHVISEAELEDVMLVISELVTNAMRHGGVGSDEVVEVHLSDMPAIEASGVVRIEVSDLRPHSHPRRQELNGDAGSEGGLGLVLVGALCPEWGTLSRNGGKAVWASYPVAAR